MVENPLLFRHWFKFSNLIPKKLPLRSQRFKQAWATLSVTLWFFTTLLPEVTKLVWLHNIYSQHTLYQGSKTQFGGDGCLPSAQCSPLNQRKKKFTNSHGRNEMTQISRQTSWLATEGQIALCFYFSSLVYAGKEKLFILDNAYCEHMIFILF